MVENAISRQLGCMLCNVHAVALAIAQIIKTHLSPPLSYIALGQKIYQSAGGEGKMQGPAH